MLVFVVMLIICTKRPQDVRSRKREKKKSFSRYVYFLFYDNDRSSMITHVSSNERLRQNTYYYFDRNYICDVRL